MQKLLSLKHWLTVPDAARHLSILFGEEVSEADVLRLALDGHLRLSVDFVNGARGQIGRVIPRKEAKSKIVPLVTGDAWIELFDNGLVIDNDRVIVFAPEIESINGVWDLAMLAGERLDVEHRYQILTDGPAVTSSKLAGTLIRLDDGTYCRIMERSASKQKSFDSK